MERNILVIWLLVLTIASPLSAQRVTVGWDANTEDDLAGYRLYLTQDSTLFTGNTTAQYVFVTIAKTDTVYELGAVNYGIQYFIAMTAYDSSGNESGYSNMLHFKVLPPDTIAPGIPANVKLEVVVDGDRIIIIKQQED